jgi:hypothetical protein
MTEKTPKHVAAAATKRPRYYASTAKKTAKAHEAYRAVRASMGVAVPKIH